MTIAFRAPAFSLSLAAFVAFAAGCTTTSALPCGAPGDTNGLTEDGGGASAVGSAATAGSGGVSSVGSGSGPGAGGGSSTGSDAGAGGGSGGSSAGTSDGDGGLDLPAAATRGASLPYFEYEAEDSTAATTNGTVLPVSTTEGNIASEASGRTAVRLQGTGQNVSFTLKHRANSIVVRYSIPDAPQGGVATATLGLYVGGVRQDLNLTSRYSWSNGAMSSRCRPSSRSTSIRSTTMAIRRDSSPATRPEANCSSARSASAGPRQSLRAALRSRLALSSRMLQWLCSEKVALAPVFS